MVDRAPGRELLRGKWGEGDWTGLFSASDLSGGGCVVLLYQPPVSGPIVTHKYINEQSLLTLVGWPFFQHARSDLLGGRGIRRGLHVANASGAL